jgi:hypothetical protein
VVLWNINPDTEFLGDPACDRIVFDPPLFEMTVEPKLLEITFTFKVRKASLIVLFRVGNSALNSVV